jgi:nitronate monooxygenase
MLEAERAGAKALVVFMEEHPRASEAWKTMRRVQADEARNCALIGKLLDHSGTPHSHATGGFFEKAVQIKGGKERILFLVKGLKWAVRRFEAELPKLAPEPREAFAKMRDSHLRSIAACEAAARSLSS